MLHHYIRRRGILRGRKLAKGKGFTPVPNIVLNNPAIPRCARSTYEAIAARAYGRRSQVAVTEDTLANDTGVSRSTISRHLKVLETLHLIQRVRRGEGLPNIIVLTLKKRLAQPGVGLAQAIEAELGGLSSYVLNHSKLTMKEALRLASTRRVHGGKPMQRSNYDGEWEYARCVCPECKEVHTEYIESTHVRSPEAWRRGGSLVVLCYQCRNRVTHIPKVARL